MAPAIEAETVEAIIRDGVPLIGAFGVTVRALGDGTATLVMPCRDDFVRPGGTITGPALFGLADVALYAAVLSRIGRVELAVTTSMAINFLRRPALVPVIAEARLLKLGRRLAYGEVLLFSEGEAEPVAHATGTYSIPPRG
ncbi:MULTISPECIES: PaaI family thioesterase [unclassified Inquilinus]|uniref:PaaI family thioesterase n=1 Tax=unclassified Inquilinus TaxID=2645927 RepID=UPI003F919152